MLISPHLKFLYSTKYLPQILLRDWETMQLSEDMSIHINLPIRFSNFDLIPFLDTFSSFRMIPIIDLNNVHQKFRESN